MIDYRRVVERMHEVGYKGWVGVEYVWIDWEHCNECDNLSRDDPVPRLPAPLARSSGDRDPC